MEILPQNVWKRLAGLFPADENSANIATKLFRDYEAHGYLNKSAGELLQVTLPAIIDFFCRVELMHSRESPILRRRDTRWMSEFDYTLVNIRGAGVNDQLGDFLRASIMLTTLRTQGIILSPMTRGVSEDLEFLESHAVLRSELVNRQVHNAGVAPDVQMTAFCEAAHLLGFVIGFDLDYRVDPMAHVVLHRPEFFLWTHEGRFTPDEAVQDELRTMVRASIVSAKKAGVVLDRETAGSALSLSSLAPILSHDGSGRTPLALRLVDGTTPAHHRESAVSYWGRVFDLWHDRYRFDFLVLRGTRSEEGKEDEIPDVSLIRKVVDAVRKSGVRRNLGVIAEGHAAEVENFGIHGVNLVLVHDAEVRADRTWFQSVYDTDSILCRANLGRKMKFSIPLEVNPGDEKSRLGRDRALIKRFVARFFGAGPSHRPLLETMGSLEGAWGYPSSLKQAVTLGWMPDPSYARKAHCIEDVASSLRDMILAGEMVDMYLDEKTAWWVIRSRRGLLIAVVSVENETSQPPEPLSSNYSIYLKKPKEMTVIEYDFSEMRGILHLSTDSIITTGPIPYKDFRLYTVT